MSSRGWGGAQGNVRRSPVLGRSPRWGWLGGSSGRGSGSGPLGKGVGGLGIEILPYGASSRPTAQRGPVRDSREAIGRPEQAIPAVRASREQGILASTGSPSDTSYSGSWSQSRKPCEPSHDRGRATDSSTVSICHLRAGRGGIPRKEAGQRSHAKWRKDAHHAQKEKSRNQQLRQDV